MHALFNWIRQAAEFIGWNVRALWGALMAVIKQKWAVFLLLVGTIYTLASDAIKWVSECCDAIAQIVVQQFDLSAGTKVLEMLPVVNTFAPLSEFFVCIVAYTLLIAILFLYRFVKSLVPTWGNT